MAVVLCAASLEAGPVRVKGASGVASRSSTLDPARPDLRTGSYEDDGSVWMPEPSYSTEVHP
jgi:hypothetical protein